MSTMAKPQLKSGVSIYGKILLVLMFGIIIGFVVIIASMLFRGLPLNQNPSFNKEDLGYTVLAVFAGAVAVIALTLISSFLGRSRKESNETVKKTPASGQMHIDPLTYLGHDNGLALAIAQIEVEEFLKGLATDSNLISSREDFNIKEIRNAYYKIGIQIKQLDKGLELIDRISNARHDDYDDTDTVLKIIRDAKKYLSNSYDNSNLSSNDESKLLSTSE